MRKLTAAESRTAALLLTLAVLALAYLLLVHWWFVAPLSRIDDEMQSLRDRQQRYAAVVAQRDVLNHRLASLSRGQADANAFLPGTDGNAATASLMQHVVETVNAHAALGPCNVTQKMPVPAPDDAQAPYRQVSANINMRCSMQALAAVLHDLAYGKPYVFVDNFSAYRNPMPDRNGTTSPLNVQMMVSGYMRSAAQGGTP